MSAHCQFLFRMAQEEWPEAMEMTHHVIAEVGGPAAVEKLLLEFRDMPVHNATAARIFNALGSEVLRR